MRSQTFSIDMLVALFLLLGLLAINFSLTYEDTTYIKAYDFVAIVHKTNFTNTTYLSELESKYNISITVSCPDFTYVGSTSGEIFVNRVAWNNGEICNISVGV